MRLAVCGSSVVAQGGEAIMTSVTLLLTIVSVFALWAFLTELVVGLLLVFKVLESIRGALERITFGVRAIERETAPVDRLIRDFPEATEKLHRALSQLANAANESRVRIDHA